MFLVYFCITFETLAVPICKRRGES